MEVVTSKEEKSTTVMEPDPLFSRYQLSCEIKKSRKMQVPFEILDNNLYNPCANMVAFSTSRERLIIWIKAPYFRYYMGLKDSASFNVCWEEQERNDASKCDKIQITQ